MKKIILLLCMFLTLIGTSCDNNDDNNSGDKLPPETQTGANTVGCLVNGQVFLPKAEGILAQTPIDDPTNIRYIHTESCANNIFNIINVVGRSFLFLF